MKLILSVIIFLFAFSADPPKSQPFILIKAARLVDPASGTVRENQALLIEGDKVKSVGAVPDLTKSLSSDSRVIDLGDATVLPGLIDCHTHVTSQPENYYEDIFRRTPIDVATTSHIYARRTLEAGFTTIRNVGAEEYTDIALRNAINAGKIPGPRMLCATVALGSTGGHADLNGFSPYLRFQEVAPGVVNGPDQIRSAVRRNIKYGADWIKILASAGVLSEEESVGAPQFSLEEMKLRFGAAKLPHTRMAPRRSRWQSARV